MNVCIFKDIVLSRNKAYNADFLCTSLEEYYLRRLRTFVNGRNDTVRHLFEDQLKGAININKDSIKQLSQNMYKVQSYKEIHSSLFPSSVNDTYIWNNCKLEPILRLLSNHSSGCYLLGRYLKLIIN